MDSYYNSPPNWPQPPAGWKPPPDWAPDPSWPAPPQNWQFWVAAPTPPPARKSGRLWLIIGLPVALFLLITVGAITAIFVTVGNAVSPPQDAARSYAEALQDHRYDDAYGMRCSERAGDYDDFITHWENLTSTGHGVKSFKIVGTKKESLNGRESAKVDVDVRYADGTEKKERMTMTKSGGNWKACD